MRFYHRKVLNGHEYTCEDIFGRIVIETPDELNADMLDRCSMAVLSTNSREGTIGGVLEKGLAPRTKENAKSLDALGSVRFRYDPASVWEEDDEGLTMPAENRRKALKRRRWADLKAAWRRFVQEVCTLLK
jgi:hypothetical protein